MPFFSVQTFPTSFFVHLKILKVIPNRILPLPPSHAINLSLKLSYPTLLLHMVESKVMASYTPYPIVCSSSLPRFSNKLLHFPPGNQRSSITTPCHPLLAMAYTHRISFPYPHCPSFLTRPSAVLLRSFPDPQRSLLTISCPAPHYMLYNHHVSLLYPTFCTSSLPRPCTKLLRSHSATHRSPPSTSCYTPPFHALQPPSVCLCSP